MAKEACTTVIRGAVTGTQGLIGVETLVVAFELALLG
jgi:hypothetical protein